MRIQIHKIYFIIFFLPFFSNCYFNPVVNGILNPLEEENNNSFLGLLGLAQGTSNLMITGQIRNPNGVVMLGLGLTPSATANNIKSTSPYMTDAGGRFYLPYQSGRISFDVSQNGSPFFTLILNVLNPNGITAETVGAPAGLEISNLRTISGSETSTFFELVNAYILDGESNEIPLHNAEVSNWIPAFFFAFTEPTIPALTTGPLAADWISQNISISPAASFDNFMIVTGNTLSVAPMSLPGPAVYEITLKSGILSATGKSLTPRTIRFTYNYAP
ncbi:hypothetical protein EHQ24_08910 [Leptospira noumeaensis]|uniref:SbsA Ig-like domain-containing protein n=1 Tax=Leptospira noumeaensis TaxID=2484964 RepID=A0A4R9I7Q5_9LEPT|nr:hypothetical protein [Leptospira noumeaensis]TGK81429.1 hypothetical protein EHQ24_08910 [Leptospira noumeaensis]